MSHDALEHLAINRTAPAKATGGRRRTVILAAAALVLAAVILAAVLRDRPVSVETTGVNQVYPTQAITLLNASGYVVAQRKAAVASKTTGRLEWLGVEEGSRVRAGEVIARLENEDLKAALSHGEAGVHAARAALEQAQAELADAEALYRRQSNLLQQGIVSRAEFDAAEARFKRGRAAVASADAGVRAAGATVKGAEVSLGYSLIRAPFDAVVLTKNADVGDIITPLGAAANAKAAVVTIADLGSLQVEADVSESNLAQVKKGQPCEITLDALPGTRFRGSVHAVVPTADRSKASVMVKVRFSEPDSRILPEMSAKVAFLERLPHADELRPRLAVNPAALVRTAAGQGVYLVKGDRVVFTAVTAGGKLGDSVEISGVASGDRVVLRPLERMKDGTRVTQQGGKP